MTSHQFAKTLLDGPDLPILVPKVKEYSEDEEDCCAIPTISKQVGRDLDGVDCDVLIISYQE